ncbi:MAG TPA: ABC transporter ATP-binding protein [Candidatus Nitrosotenuis sp.]|nr:ABC transporter ATP-binding protein [Candidatus Nitrosotenuis sp.]
MNNVAAAPAVETTALSKTYKKFFRAPSPALVNASVRVEPGTIFGLLGQNGAGKTTLVKILLGLISPTGGQAKVLGAAPHDARMRRRVGYLPEQMRLPEYLRAESYLSMMAALNGADGRDVKKRIPALLDLVSLNAEKKRLKEYSKGMQQRLGIAQAMVHDPDLLFLDEPTEGLDPLGRKQIRDLLVTLRAGGKTIFLNSHLLSEIELVCDQIVILYKGQVARAGTPAQFTGHTGEYRIRVHEANDRARAAVCGVIPQAHWEESSALVTPQDRAQLNAIIDRLRAAQVEIEAIEPVRSTLEEFFIQVVTGEGS